MIKPNWEIFTAKFTDKENTFEWFAYLLFCREFELPKGWFGFKNQSAIEKEPLKVGDEVIGFQAKFYSSSLSDHKDEFLSMLEKARRDYPELTKILIYTNQAWGQGRDKGKMTLPQALVAIQDKAKKLGIQLEWKEASFFESEFVCLQHGDLAKYFFTSHSMHGWQRFSDWSSTQANLDAEYLIDDGIKIISPRHKSKKELNLIDGINEIRKKLQQLSSSVRLVGLSGVGKTRLAQALFDERIGEQSLDHRIVWYCDMGDSPDPIPEHFVEELIQKDDFAILIIDNCGQDTHANLTRKLQGKKLALLTIEYDVRDDLPESTLAYKLEPTSIDIVQKVIARHYPHINDLNTRKIAEATGGNYRLALAIASNIDRADNISQLTDSQLFERLFWQKGEKDKQLEKIAQYFALVYSFNVEDSEKENSELVFLAGLANVDAYTAYEEIEKLRQKDIVQRRGEWRAILPHALANSLAKEAVSRKPVAKLNRDFESMPPRLQRSCIKRLSYLHEQSKVQELVGIWFNKDGWLGNAILNDQLSAESLTYIRLLAPICPDQVLNLIQKKHEADEGFLTRDNPYFRELSRLIRRLAYKEENFKQAFWLLVEFASMEDKGERNNSIRELVTSLFKLYTSETLICLEKKKEVLQEMWNEKKFHSLLIECIDKALNFRELGTLYNYEDDGQEASYGYQPKTYDEIWAWTDFLLNLLNHFDDIDIKDARRIFTSNLKSIIWKTRRLEEVKKYLYKFNAKSYFSEAYIKIKEILTFNKVELEQNAPQLLKELEDLKINLAPKKDNIQQLLSSYVFVDDHTIYRLCREDDYEYSLAVDGFGTYGELIDFLAARLKDLAVLQENIDKLIHANSGWSGDRYLEKLGYGSANAFNNVDSFIAVLEKVAIADSLSFSEFLIGMVKSFKEREVDEYRKLIGYFVSREKFQKLVGTLIFKTCYGENDFIYFCNLISEGKIILDYLPNLSFYKYHNGITEQQFEILLDAVISRGEKVIIQHLLLNECFFQKKLVEKYIDLFLINLPEIVRNTNNNYDVEIGLGFLLTLGETIEQRVFLILKDYFQEQEYLSMYQNQKDYDLLKTLIEKSTNKFLTNFIEDENFLEKLVSSGRFRKILAYANSEEVLSWIATDQSKLEFWVENTRLFNIQGEGEITWSDLLVELLRISSDPASTLEKVIESNIFNMRSASGSWSEEMQRRLPSITALKTKLEVLHPPLLALINQKEEEWLQRIEKQSKMDEQESRRRDERFDW